MRKKIYGILMLAGLLYLLGTAGASDAEIITVKQLDIQLTISILLLFVGGFGYNLEERRGR